MSIRGKSILLSVALAAMILPAAAQDSTPAVPAPEPTQKKETKFRERQENERNRIARGVKNGELTQSEAKHLERQHRALNAEAAHMRKEDGGTLTAQDKAKLNGQQNRESHRIYRAKHNDNTRK